MALTATRAKKSTVRKTKNRPARKRIPLQTRIDVLTEAGYRCSVPGCNVILTLNIHHLDPIAKGGGNSPDNLLALCPNHHTLYHEGHIPESALRVYKGMQVALFEGFGKQARDQLLFLSQSNLTHFYTSDATLQFVPLIVAGLVELQMQPTSSVDFLADPLQSRSY
jgi:hypothetical protein